MDRDDLNDIIKKNMDALQECMESNMHLDDQARAIQICSDASKYSRFMTEDDRDYVFYASEAIAESFPWGVP